MAKQPTTGKKTKDAIAKAASSRKGAKKVFKDKYIYTEMDQRKS